MRHASIEHAPGAAIGPGERFLDALRARDFERMEQLIDENAQFRALTPSAVRTASGPGEAVGWMRKWVGNADEFEMIDSSMDVVVDRLRLSYRLQVHEPDGWFIVEQQVYCAVANERLASMDLVCSGFRPISAP